MCGREVKAPVFVLTVLEAEHPSHDRRCSPSCREEAAATKRAPRLALAPPLLPGRRCCPLIATHATSARARPPPTSSVPRVENRALGGQ
ncbi:hypothetical protein E2C01_021544 [Portunus trituberculatus]|uniref:Uncharacterized protein n=1 Tax=Portunus trituberculatus TaxID=210409 RepID=A0A5B7E2U4_PORTR|nr:hypothetical protein [Portunus trituberculatus]